MKIRLTLKNRIHRKDINRPRTTNVNKRTKYKMCLNVMMCLTYPTFEAQIMETLNNTEA